MTRRMQPKQPRKKVEGGLSDERFVAAWAMICKVQLLRNEIGHKPLTI